MLKERQRFFRSVLIAADTALVAASAVGAYFIRFGLLAGFKPPRPDEVVAYSTHAIPVTTAVPIMFVCMLWAGLYRPRRDQRFEREARGILKAVVIGVIATFAFISFFGRVLFNDLDPSRVQYLVWAALMGASLLAWRLSFRTSLRFIRRRGWNLRHVAIIGTGRLGQVVGRTLHRNSWTGINPVMYVSHHRATARRTCADVPVAGGIDDLETLLEGRDISGVFIALPGRMTAMLPELIARLQRFSLDVRVVPDMNPRFLPVNMAASELDGMPVLSVRQSPLEGWGGVLKRAFDIAGGAAAIAAFAVPMAVIAMLVRSSGPGPVIFRQQRMSLNGQRFEIFKFRTMRHVDAEAQALRDAGRGTDAWTRKDDPRVTRVGRFLRRTSLDELPQLFNVLLGEMSLVGPRPERPELIQRFREDWRGYMLRQHVKAGMTGWAQVNGYRGDTSLRKRLQYDLFYIRNWSLLFDLRILWMTVFRGFAHANAR